MKEKNKYKYIVSGVCFGILVLFMLSIGVRFFTRQILINKMGMNNTFTRLIFFDNENMQENSNVQGSDEGCVINWEKYYPFEEINQSDSIGKITCWDKYHTRIASLEQKINVYTQDLLMGQKIISYGHFVYNKLINWKLDVAGADKNSTIIFMKNGYLTYRQPQIDSTDMEEIADSVKDFSDYLKKQNIPFLYVNAGFKVNPEDKELPAMDETEEHSNENEDALLAALEKRGVTYLDMRKEMLDAGLDWYGSWYKTDVHWTTETGLWAAGIVADHLNRVAKMNFDPDYFSRESYSIKTYKDAMFGTQGATVTHTNAKPEDYVTIFPTFDTDFSVEIPTKSYNERGDYKNTLYDLTLLENGLKYKGEKNLYLTTRWQNDSLGIVKNNCATNNKDKKILILQDSFGWYLTTYLACDVGEIDMIHPMKFTGSIRAYVETMKPDAVVVLYCESNIQKINWETHTSSFDFR